MENPTFAQKTKKVFKRVLIIAVLIGLGVLAVLYFGYYEKGEMAGRVLRVSEKGFIFKTHEGKLSLESFGALKGVSPIAETFDFSVASGEDKVIEQLGEVALSGERVTLHFTRRFMTFPWRGDTKYFITSVERSTPPESK